MITYRLEEDKNRAAAYDEGKEAGECVYSKDGNVWTIVHTGVDPAYGGQGIAGKLLELVVNAAKAEKVRIDPVCSYAAHAFEKREDWKNLRV